MHNYTSDSIFPCELAPEEDKTSAGTEKNKVVKASPQTPPTSSIPVPVATATPSPSLGSAHSPVLSPSRKPLSQKGLVHLAYYSESAGEYPQPDTIGPNTCHTCTLYGVYVYVCTCMYITLFGIIIGGSPNFYRCNRLLTF